MKKMIVSSIHTCTPYALQKFYPEVDGIVSVDSHLDDKFMNFSPGITKTILKNKPLLYAMGRPAVHAVNARMLDFLDTTHVIMNPGSFATEVSTKFNKIQRDMSDFKIDFEFIREMKTMMKEINKIELHLESTVDPFKKIRRILRQYGCPVLDIDVDYMWEMQGECYTPMRKAPQTGFGSMNRMLKTIKKLSPKVITISESTIKTHQDKDSNTNHFLNSIEKMVYQREDFWFYEDDKQAQQNMWKADGFHEYFAQNKVPLDNLDKLDEIITEQARLSEIYFNDDTLGLVDPYIEQDKKIAEAQTDDSSVIKEFPAILEKCWSQI